MRKTFLYLLAIALVGCAGSKIALTDAESTNYAYGKSKFAGYSKTQFAQGRTIDQNNCGRCHKLKNPANFTEEQLNKIIPRMAQKAKITDEEKDLVLKYYISAGKRS